MSQESFNRGQEVYLEMLNHKKIENGLGGNIQKGKQRKMPNRLAPIVRRRMNSRSDPNWYPGDN